MNPWNERYAASGFFYGIEPNDFLKVCAPHLKPASRILSLGEGEGRNAAYLLGLGHELVCVDGSTVARDKALTLCEPYLSRLEYRVEDLSQSRWDETFDAVISIWCHLPSQLRKRVHASAVAALKPGGWFVLEAYRPEQIPLGTGGPKDIDMLLTPDVLQTELRGLNILLMQETLRHIEEGEGHKGRSATLQLLAQRFAETS
jgi:SAM-dependent methyltransferase